MAAPDKSIPSKQFNIVHYTVSGKKLYDMLTKAEQRCGNFSTVE